MPAQYDVIILGYGPVGAVLANLLGRDGLRVAAVDRLTGIYDKPRAINIDHEAMRTLQSVGLAKAVESITIHHTGTEFRGVEGSLIKAFKPMLPPYPLGWAPNLMFIQPEFEPLLRQGAARFPTVETLLGREAVDLEQDEDEVRVHLAPATSGPDTVHARLLVACDGATSPTRKRLGITQDSLDFDEWWTVVDAWLKPGALVPASTTQYCTPSGPTTYVVGPRGLRRWELKLLPHESPADYEHPEAVRRRLSAFVDPDSINIWRVATYRFHALVAHEWRRGRILLAGDAAHQMPPFMAQGLCSGLRDASNLGWKLTGVLRDGWPDSLLDTYELERKPHLERLVATTKALGLIIGELDPDLARDRDERLGFELVEGRSETLRQALVPDLSTGIIAHDAQGVPNGGAGALSPQPVVCDATGRRALLDDLVGPHFLLITLGREAQGWVGRDEGAAWERLGGKRLVLTAPGDTADDQDTVREEASLLHDWMHKTAASALLTRPDGYVFGTASDAGTLNRHIRTIAAAVVGFNPKLSGNAEL